MIKDVRSYLARVSQRLSRAFDIRDFEQEDQVEFWALGAELLSRKQAPGFREISQWIDRAFKAPVHFVYRKQGDRLELFRRHIINENVELLSKTRDQDTHALRRQIEDQVENMTTKITCSDQFKTEGTYNFTVGMCQYIPLYQGNSLWGIYCLGPNMKIPESLLSRISTVSNILSMWVIKRYERQERGRYGESNKMQESIIHQAGQNPQIEDTFHYLLSSLIKTVDAKAGLLTFEKKQFTIIQSVKIPAKIADAITEYTSDTKKFDVNHFFEEHQNLFNANNFKAVKSIPIGKEESCIFFYPIFGKKEENIVSKDELSNRIGDTVAGLLQFKSQNFVFIDQLMDTYYIMLRDVEKQKEQTYYHSPRVLAFCESFAEAHDLNAEEKELLFKSARMHDIGYICSDHMTVGTEIEHPIMGKMMLDGYGLPLEITMGVATHQEWMDGSGTPHGLKSEQIPWTAKIIAIFEFVVEYIEKNKNASSTDSKLEQELINELKSRSGSHFEREYVATAINIIQSLGWNNSKKLGTSDDK